MIESSVEPYNNCPDHRCAITINRLYEKLSIEDPGKANKLVRDFCEPCIQMARNQSALDEMKAEFLRNTAALQTAKTSETP